MHELEKCILQQISESASNQIKEEQEQIKALRARSTYAECYDKKGFKVKELGTEIDEEVKTNNYLTSSIK